MLGSKRSAYDTSSIESETRLKRVFFSVGRLKPKLNETMVPQMNTQGRVGFWYQSPSRTVCDEACCRKADSTTKPQVVPKKNLQSDFDFFESAISLRFDANSDGGQ